MVNIYVVRDAQLGFMSMFTATNDAVAIRNFASGVNSPGTVIHDSPEDFALCRLGSFDDEKGVISSELPTVVASAVSVLRKE